MYVKLRTLLLCLLIVSTYLYVVSDPIEYSADEYSPQDNSELTLSVSDSLPAETPIYSPARYVYPEESSGLNYEDDWCHYSELSDKASIDADIENEDWLLSRGHFAGQFNGYEAYPVEQLKELAQGGDLRAPYVLVYVKDSTTELKFWAAKNAAIYGGTGLTMSYITTTYAQKYERFLTQGKNADAKSALLESLAWREFAAMRGDFLHLEAGVYTVSLSIGSIDLSSSDMTSITTRARQIYRQLESSRISKGLGEFDKDLPRIIKKKNAWAAASLLAKGWSKWGHQYLNQSECVQKNVKSFLKNEQF